ncbi:TadE/TadG family type IV pilus assembly protein [uncultured Enterovirga sp.]|uniref:TadE/TadG family type IV pilus assembly protein n=1 Tax=uncultured Enterovirga sp. TaxID=2026352 RepID=UPI0035CBCDA5
MSGAPETPGLTCRPWLARCCRQEEGAAILEFALVLPILLALVAGSFELGRALLVRHAMANAVRGGARYLARVPDPTCRAECSLGAARAVSETRDQIVGATGLAPAAIRITPTFDPGAGIVTMRADVPFRFELLRTVGFGPGLTLVASHQEPRIAD